MRCRNFLYIQFVFFVKIAHYNFLAFFKAYHCKAIFICNRA